MFSKALFKQSCKANGIMWGIITIAVCFMLACVMLITGNGNITNLKDGMSDTIIMETLDSTLKTRSVNYYMLASDALLSFDKSFVQGYTEIGTFASSLQQWSSLKPKPEDYSTDEQFQEALSTWLSQKPPATTESAVLYESQLTSWENKKPNRDTYPSDEAFLEAMSNWQSKMPKPDEVAYMFSLNSLNNYTEKIISDKNLDRNSNDALEIKGLIFYTLNPAGAYNSFYEGLGETAPIYDLTSITNEDRVNYINEYTRRNASIFLAGNMISQANIDKIVQNLQEFNITNEMYKEFTYTIKNGTETVELSKYTGESGYSFIKELSNNTLITFQGRLTYELEKGTSLEDAVNLIMGDISSSFISSLPEEVSNALTELGEMDLFSMIVGSIFFKMAGLLLPIIYMIMAANNLIAGQVDSGSMAYVLSTSTKRKQVIFTQAIFLVGSLFMMFLCTTITSVVCLAALNSKALTISIGQMILLNFGAFITMFAMSGISFLASCWFNRSKFSMSIGGGVNMFFLVASMLGLFGSSVLPSVVRLGALNSFNFMTIISLFDVVSILDGTTTFIWKLAILAVVGLICYFIGAEKFKRKDLPL